MRDPDLLSKAIRAFLVSDCKGVPCWKEWNFYARYELFEDLGEALFGRVSRHLDDIDCVISLSKSGFPLGSWFALRARKPLFLFSIGELFHPNGASVIGLYPEGKIAFRRALVVDSHVNTGMTYRLFTKVCATLFDKRAFAVLIDVRNGDSFEIEDPVIQVYGRGEVWGELLKIKGVDRVLLGSDDFWMREEEYWLSGVPHLNLAPRGKKGISFENIGTNELRKSLQETLFGVYLGKWNTVSPLRLYQKPDLFEAVLNDVVDRIGDQKVDATVASSLGAVPLAIGLCIKMKQRGKRIRRFIFLGNGSLRFYGTLFEECKHVLICDDMVASGGLLYRIYEEFIKREARKLVGVVTIFDQDEFPRRDYLERLPADARYLTVVKATDVKSVDKF